MATTSTLKTILEELTKRLDLGVVVVGATGTTSGVTYNRPPLRGPFTGSRFPRGSMVLATNGAANVIGQCRYLSTYTPSTGVIAVDPLFSSAFTQCVVVKADTGIDHTDRMIEAVNRAVQYRCGRWQKTALTFVADGDLMGTTVTDYWTGSSATPTYVTPTFPAGSAAAVYGNVNLQRVLQSVTSGATNYVRSNLIDVPLNASQADRKWYFQTAVRVVTGGGNAQIVVYDETNSANITVDVITGADDGTHVTNSLEFVVMSGTFNVPEDCKQLSFRLVSSATTTTIQMTPLVAFPAGASSFPLPNRIIFPDERIGNFYYGTCSLGPGGTYDIDYSDSLCTAGRTAHISDFGDHLTVQFNFRPLRPVYFDEQVFGSALSAMTDTTTESLDRVVRWAEYELTKWLYKAEEKRTREDGVPIPARWKTPAREAKKAADWGAGEPGLTVQDGRV